MMMMVGGVSGFAPGAGVQAPKLQQLTAQMGVESMCVHFIALLGLGLALPGGVHSDAYLKPLAAPAL
jgi:hypothetical protein